MNKQEKLEQELRVVLNPIISDFASRMVIAQQKFINHCVDNNMIVTTAQIESICGTYRRPAKRTINMLVKRVINQLFEENNTVYLRGRTVETIESINANIFRENAVDTPLEALSKGNTVPYVSEEIIGDDYYVGDENIDEPLIEKDVNYVEKDEEEYDLKFHGRDLNPEHYHEGDHQKFCKGTNCNECIFDNTSVC